MQARVLILATGGTIAGAGREAACTADYESGVLPIADLVAAVPGLDRAAALQTEPFAAIDSKNATPQFWMRLASRVQAAADDPTLDAVVITHGTDTLEESAYFLHLTVKTRKPIVFTGAMRPATALSADGPLNLLNAVRVAAHPGAAGKGVLVVLNDLIHCARDVAKVHNQRVDAFASPDAGPLGFVQDRTVHWHRPPVHRHTAESALAWTDPLPRVEILYGYAGVSAWLVDAMTAAPLDGIVYAGTGNGTMPDEVEAALGAAAQRGLVVVRSSRVGAGTVLRNGGVDDDARGFVVGDNLNPQKARVLLTLALCGAREVGVVQRLFDAY